ncbi:hypothetical protein BDV97DRAFT_91794 [Delphinella strobiligena]|nr:hypothetical protein BDV97DRAFT_91794 [Delphinella strobiligena]
MATTLSPHPPHHPQSTTRISPTHALTNITAFLGATETNPHLHPDAQLDPREIKFSTTGGPGGGLVLHNLRRVEKGLSGEVLAPEQEELDGIFGEGERGETPRRKGGLKRTSAYDDEVLDPVEYALSQEVLVGGGDGDVDLAGGEAMDVDVDAEEMGAGLTSRDKAARKEEKKRRKKAEQKEREQQRAGNKG